MTIRELLDELQARNYPETAEVRVEVFSNQGDGPVADNVNLVNVDYVDRAVVLIHDGA